MLETCTTLLCIFILYCFFRAGTKHIPTLSLAQARVGEEHIPETLEYGVSSFTYRARKPFLSHLLVNILEAMLNQGTAPFDTSCILRANGFVWLASFNYSLVPGNPWWQEIDKEHWPDGLEDALAPLWQEPFIIGQDLDKIAITNALNECLVSDEDLDKGWDTWSQICKEAMKIGAPQSKNAMAKMQRMDTAMIMVTVIITATITTLTRKTYPVKISFNFVNPKKREEFPILFFFGC